MLLIDLLEAIEGTNWNVSFTGKHHDPVVRSHLATLSFMGTFFSLVREKDDTAFGMNAMKHNRYCVYGDEFMVDPIATIDRVSKEFPNSNLTLIINFDEYINLIVSQHFSEYTVNPESIVYEKFSSIESQIEFYSPSKEKTYVIVLKDIDNSSINKMKLMAKDFYLKSVTINKIEIINELKDCKWSFDIGDYND